VRDGPASRAHSCLQARLDAHCFHEVSTAGKVARRLAPDGAWACSRELDLARIERVCVAADGRPSLCAAGRASAAPPNETVARELAQIVAGGCTSRERSEGAARTERPRRQPNIARSAIALLVCGGVVAAVWHRQRDVRGNGNQL
jgi:hypothetical protein